MPRRVGLPHGGCRLGPGYTCKYWAGGMYFSPPSLGYRRRGVWGYSDYSEFCEITHGSCAALPRSCGLTMPLSLQVEDIKPAGVSNTPELLAASTELGPEDPAGSSSGEDAPDVASGDAQKPEADVSSRDGSEQEADADCDDSSSLSQYGVRTPLCWAIIPPILL